MATLDIQAVYGKATEALEITVTAESGVKIRFTSLGKDSLTDALTLFFQAMCSITDRKEAIGMVKIIAEEIGYTLV